MKIVLMAIGIAVIIAGSLPVHSKISGTHIWIQKGDSAIEITNYFEGNCLPNPNTYCSYTTTTNFPFHSMHDSVFQALISAGYFTGHRYNFRYLQ